MATNCQPELKNVTTIAVEAKNELPKERLKRTAQEIKETLFI